jgi:hypothetical protein
MKGLGLKLLKIHLLFLSFLPLFIDNIPNPNPEVIQGRTVDCFKSAPPFNSNENKLPHKFKNKQQVTSKIIYNLNHRNIIISSTSYS